MSHARNEPASQETLDGMKQGLKDLLFELPFKTGTATVRDNLIELAGATLRYYQFGITHPEQAASLPVGLTDDAPTSNQHDIASVAGYLALEQRMGRISPGVSPDHAGALLMGALVTHALTSESGEASDDNFAYGMVDILLEGIGAGGDPA